MDKGKDFLEDGLLEEFSLESILAEYKGSAFIDGDKRTPSHILNEKTEKIIMEVTGKKSETVISSVSDDTLRLPQVKPAAPVAPDYSEREAPKARPVAEPVKEGPWKAEPRKVEPDRERKAEAKAAPVRAETAEIKADAAISDEDILFFENFTYSAAAQKPETVREVEDAIKQVEELEEKTESKIKKMFSIFSRAGDSEAESESEIFDDTAVAEEEPDEPELSIAAREFAAKCNSISLRQIAAVLVSIIMAVFTFAYEAGKALPFGIGDNLPLVSGIQVIMLLIVMILGIDLIVRGAEDIIKGKPNVESLILFSSAISIITGIYIILSESAPQILSYSVVNTVALTCAMWGEKHYTKALAETLKTASTSSEPFGVVSEYRADVDKTLLKKVFGKTDGFYNNLMYPDIGETAYKFAVPLILVAALVMSLLTVAAKDVGKHLLHMLSALLTAGASFSALSAFAFPFSIIAKDARRTGAALAGWGGADDFFCNDGVCITDEDFFPTGTISLNGVKIFEEISPEKALRYTGSLIIASGSGLTRVFSDLLSKQAMSMIKVEDFSCYEGGIGALIRGERVMVGSAAFMQLLGIRIPSDMNMKNAIFTVVNDKLIAMFSVNYVPTNSVQNALISILKRKVKLLFAVRDFNITHLMIEQKFKVPLDDLETIPIKNTYDISDASSASLGRVTSILAREGLGPYGTAISLGILLRKTALLSVVISVVTAVLGMLIMFFVYWTGAYESARPGNLLIFMLCMFIVNLISCAVARFRK